MADFVDRNRNEIKRSGINAVGWVKIKRELVAELNRTVDLVGQIGAGVNRGNAKRLEH